MPPAYIAPTTLPALVPATTSTVIPFASSILITPMWAKPLAAPPPSARPTRTGGGAGSGAGVGSISTGATGRTSPCPQAASRSAAHGSSRERRWERFITLGGAVENIAAEDIRRSPVKG